jgi:Domain of unknown function (DUF4192)
VLRFTVHRSADARLVRVGRPQAHHMTSSRKSARRRRRRPPQTRLKVRRPDELLAIVPYMIGFHPDESIVAVFVSSGRIALMARMDLPPESAGDELAKRIDGLATQHKADALALVAYSANSLPTNRLLTRLMNRLGKHKLTDVLYVGHGRWWSLTCDEECCPLAGTPFDLSSHPMSAAAVFAGLGARADRRELEACVSGPSQAELPRVEAVADALLTELDFDDPSAAVRLLISIVEAAGPGADGLDERNCLLLGLLVTDTGLRDLAWALISPTNAEDHIRLWGQRGGAGAGEVGRRTAVPAGHGSLAQRSRRPAELLLRAAGTGRTGVLHGQTARRDQRQSSPSVFVATDGR